MDIQTVIDYGDVGYVVNGIGFIPKDIANNDYRDILEWEANGGVIEPFTPNPNDSIMGQIADLEAQQTPRLMREALAGVQFAIDKLAAIDAEISVLRGELWQAH